MLPTQPSWVRFLVFLNFYNFDVAEIYLQQHCIKSVGSAKILIVDQTQLAAKKIGLLYVRRFILFYRPQLADPILGARLLHLV